MDTPTHCPYCAFQCGMTVRVRSGGHDGDDHPSDRSTLTNLEGRVLMRRKAVTPPPQVRTDLEILSLIAHRLGRGRFIETDPERVFAELAKTSAGGIADYAGLSYARLQTDDALFWPCPAPDHPGTPRLFADPFPTPDGRARFHTTGLDQSADAADPLTEEFPFYLTTGRLLAHYQTGSQTHRCASLESAEPEPFAQIHPQLAATFGLGQGDWVTLRTRRGAAVMRVRLSGDMRLDTVFVPFHWSGPARANTLTPRVLDPAARIPQFKLSAVALERTLNP